MRRVSCILPSRTEAGREGGQFQREFPALEIQRKATDLEQVLGSAQCSNGQPNRIIRAHLVSLTCAWASQRLADTPYTDNETTGSGNLRSGTQIRMTKPEVAELGEAENPLLTPWKVGRFDLAHRC